jgi:hypothetical protein
MKTILNDITPSSFFDTLYFIERCKNNAQLLLDSIDEKGEEADNETLIKIKEEDSAVKAIVITYQQRPQIASITFYGKLSMTFGDLISVCGLYRYAYSHYDDSYFYFFNESKSIGSFVVSTFLSVPQTDLSLHGTFLKNLKFDF